MIILMGDCTSPSEDKYVYGKTRVTGLIGRSRSLLFNTHGHFRFKGQHSSSIFHPHTDVLEYQLAEYRVPSLQSQPMIIREVIPELKRGFIHRGLSESACDKTRPPVSVETGSFTPFHIGHSTLFHYDAFWAFPPGIHFERLHDLWWSFAVQKLLWITGNRVHVASMPFVQYDLILSKQATHRANTAFSKFILFLSNWQCNGRFQKCSELLFNAMYKRSYLSTKEFNTIMKWLYILMSNGYVWPNTRFDEDLRRITSVQFTTTEHNKPYPCPRIDCVTNDIETSYRDVYQQSHFYKTNSNIMLLVQFNHPTYSAIPFIEYAYRPAFKHIIYCGPEKLNASYNVNFVMYNGESDGSLFYTCVAFVMQIAFKVNGILLISDDVIINFNRWNLIDKSRSIISYADTDGIRLYDTDRMKRCFHNVYNCTTPASWWWMKKESNMKMLRSLYDDIYDLEHNDSSVQQALKRMKSNFGGKARMLSTYSDMFYIPGSLWQNFIKFSQLFERHGMFVENTGPTITTFISNPKEIQLEKAIQMSYHVNRSKPWLRWPDIEGSLNLMYIHPVKLGQINNNSNVRTLFCRSIIPEIVRSLSTVRKKGITRAPARWKDVLYIR